MEFKKIIIGILVVLFAITNVARKGLKKVKLDYGEKICKKRQKAPISKN